MQAALMISSKRALRRKERIRRGFKNELPSNIATKEIGPFPRYPPQSWCAQGKAAWQEAAAGAARRCSVVATDANAGGGHRSKQTEAHLRWMKRNRIHDLSYGGSSSDEEEGGIATRVTNVIGSLLYIGLGTTALGLVITFVGTGEKGFKTPELRYTGPALIIAGLACCLIRILLCACPAKCVPRSRSRSKQQPAVERPLLSSSSDNHHHQQHQNRSHHHHHHHHHQQDGMIGDALPMAALTLQARTPPSEAGAAPPAPAPSPAKPVPRQPPANPVPLLVLSPVEKDGPVAPLDGSSLDVSSILSTSSESSGHIGGGSHIDVSADEATVIDLESSSSSRREASNAPARVVATSSTTAANYANANSGGSGSAGVNKLVRQREPAYASTSTRPSAMASTSSYGGGGMTRSATAGSSGLTRTVTFADTPSLAAQPSLSATNAAAEIVLTPSNLAR